MFGQLHYVPILKGKMGELGALESLENTVKERMTPLIEVPRIPWDHEKDRERKSIDAHVQKVASKLAVAWGTNAPVFLDLPFLTPGEFLADGSHPVSFVAQDARQRGVQAVPVTGLRRDDAYQGAVAAAVERDSMGACLRLEADDFEDLRWLRHEVEGLTGRLGAGAELIDVVIDMRELHAGHNVPAVLAIQSMLASLPNVERWRSLTFAGSAFPENLSAFPSAHISRTERAEWVTWRMLTERGEVIPRLPSFGDYGIQHPDPAEIDPRIIRMSANLRYAARSEWILLKGRSIKTHGPEQFNGLCKMLVSMDEYGGRNHCWGDSYIGECAEGKSGPGSPTTWRKVGTAHHLTLVAEEIASLF